MSSEQPSRWRPWMGGGGLIWSLIGLLVLLGFNAINSPGFFHLELREGHLYGTLVDILHQGSKVMLLAIGMTLIIATGGVDLSVGSIMAIAGATAAVLVTKTTLSFAWVLGLSLGVASLAGAANGALVAWIGIQPIIATLILMVAGRGIAMLITDGQIITFEHPALVYLGNGSLLTLPVTISVVAGLLGITLAMTRLTAFGLFLESTGDNQKAAGFCGVPTSWIKWMVYVFSGLCAGLAGLVATSNIKAADSSRVGEMMELDAIFAVVVGGTALTGGRFSLLGSIVGALLIQTLTTTIYNLGVPPAVSPVPKAVVIVLVCLIQSERFRAQFSGLRERKRA